MKRLATAHLTRIVMTIMIGVFLTSQMVVAQAENVTVMDWSPDGMQIAIGVSNGQIRILDAQTHAVTTTFQAHTGEVFKLAYSPDGTKLASVSSSGDGIIKIWNPKIGQIILAIQVATTNYPLLSLAWSPDGSKIAAGGLGSSGVYDSTTGQPLNALPDPSAKIREVISLVWSPDGSRVATGTTEGIIRIWSIATSQETLSISNNYNAGQEALAWSPDGQKISGDGYDNKIRIWSASTGQLLNTLSGHTQAITSTKWSVDNTRLLSNGLDGTVRIWDMVTGQLIQTMLIASMPYAIAWSPDGTKLAYGGNDGTLQIVSVGDVLSATPTLTPPTASQPITPIASATSGH